MRLPGHFPPDDPVGHDWFATGMNYPWIGTYGCDIGPNQIAAENVSHPNGTRFDGTAGRWIARLQADFRRLKAWGIDVVRIWAFERGEGLTWERAGDHWVVSGIHPQFLSHVAAITQTARNEHIRIYWTLLQSKNFHPHEYREEGIGSRRMSEAFYFMLMNEASRRRFFERAVRPFIDRLLQPRYRGGLFAIDLMNEPDMLWFARRSNVLEAISRMRPDLRSSIPRIIERLYPRHLRSAGPLQEQRVITLLVEMAQFIRENYENTILISAGFAYANTFQRHHYLFNRLFDFYDFHLYDVVDVTNLTPSLPRINSSEIGNKPCLIGECGLGGQVVEQREYFPMLGRGISCLGYRLPEGVCQFPRSVTFRDLLLYQAVCIRHFLTSSRRRGLAGCFVWEYGRQYRRVYDMPRALSSTSLDWTDRFPMLWQKQIHAPIPAHLCIHLREESEQTPEELCGRPAAQVIRSFANDLASANLRPR
jgi:hypothetical protein